MAFKPTQSLAVLGCLLVVTGCFQRDTETNVVKKLAVTSPSTSPAPGPAPMSTPTVVPSPLILEAVSEILPGQAIQLRATGGKAPYTFSVASGPGSVTAAGVLTITSVDMEKPIIVQVTDSMGVKVTQEVLAHRNWNMPNDTYFSTQWNLHDRASGLDVDAPEGWAFATDCSNVPIGVVDSGIDYDHPDLAQNVWTNKREIAANGADDDQNGFVDDVRGWNFNAENNNSKDGHYHGTHVAGIIGAIGNNATGVAGVCWKANMIPVRISDDNGAIIDSDVVDGIDYAVKMGSRVINLSLGGPQPSQKLSDAINRATAAGVLVVIAAGNNGTNNDTTPQYPANYAKDNPAVIAVANSGKQGGLDSTSNFGVSSVNIAAPGMSISSTIPLYLTKDFPDAVASLSGTSMAAPHVTAAAALLLQRNPAMTAAQVKSRLISTSVSTQALQGKISSGGRLNLSRLLDPTK